MAIISANLFRAGYAGGSGQRTSCLFSFLNKIVCATHNESNCSVRRGIYLQIRIIINIIAEDMTGRPRILSTRWHPFRSVPLTYNWSLTYKPIDEWKSSTVLMLAPEAGANNVVIFPDHHWSGAALAILPSFPFTSAFPASRLLLALIAGGVAYAASDQTDTESGVPKTWVSWGVAQKFHKPFTNWFHYV